MGFLLLFLDLPADLAVVVVHVREGEVELAGVHLLDDLEHAAGEARRDAEAAEEMR
jgi:hypothetical protein